MSTNHIKKLALSRHLVLSGALLLLFMVPLSAFGQEQSSIATLRQIGKAFASIAEKTSPAVVSIQVEKTVKAGDVPQMREWSFGDPYSPFGDDFFRYFFGRPDTPQRRRQQQPPKQMAQASGFIISRDGYILTNNHLVGDVDKVTVKLAGGEKFTAKVIGADPESDVALVKIEKDNLPYIELADSDKLEVGEWVIAIGNPFGFLSHTVTAGIVSAKGRSRIGVADYEDFIQTDAAINFGNSGGPLLNLDGKAVGINTAIIGPGGNIGIGLAIPINIAKSVYKQLIDTGKVVRGWLGVTIQDLEPDMAKSFGVESNKGVLIADVNEGGAADKAGFKYGDVVVELEGQPVDTANDFRNRVAMHKPGSKIEVTVLRDGKRRKLTADLDKRPEEVAMRGGTKGGTSTKLGISVQSLTDELARRLGYEGLSGVVVTEVEPGSLAAEAGLTNGALIMEVNRKPVRNVREFNDAMKRASEDGKVLLRVRDEDYTRFIILPLSDK